MEVAAGKALGRQVTIAGPVELEFSNWPALEVSDVNIANAAGAAQADFLNAGLARMQIGVFPLLRGEINIAEVTAENVTLNLENDVQGRPNWIFDGAAAAKEQEPDKTETDGKLITFAALDRLSLKQINVNYHDAALDKSLSFVLDSMEGTAAKNEPLNLHFAGKVQDRGYDLKLEGSPIVELQDWEEPWGFELKGVAFDKEIASKGDLIMRGHRPEINLALVLRDVDVGYILAQLGLVEGMQASLGDVGMKVSINGGSLMEVLQQSSLLFKVKDGNWNVRLPNSEASLQIRELGLSLIHI